MAEHRITLRPTTDSDSELVYQIKKTAMKVYIDETWGWDEEFQRDYHNSDFSPLKYRLIDCDGEVAGIFAVSLHETDMRVNEIMLLPPYQGQGIGSALLGHVIIDAHDRHLPVRLQVLKTNHGARRLYERLAFTVSGETATHFTMECAP